MKKLFENKFFLVLLGLALGIAGTLAGLHIFPQRQPRDEMQERMDQFRRDWNDKFGESEEIEGIFEKFFKNGVPGNTPELKQSEDANTVTYEITIRGLAEEKVSVNVSNGMIRISGKTEVSQRDARSGVFNQSVSSFERSFPVPENVDEQSLQIQQEKNKLILRFTKVGSA